MNMSKLCPKCEYFVGAPLLSSTALIFLAMEFTRAAHVVAGILFHSSIMTSQSCRMLDTWCFSTFRLRMPHMCLIGFRSYLATPSPSPSAARQLSSWQCVCYVVNQFLKRGHHLLLQNVTVHVGINVSLNEPQLPTVPAVVMQPQTMMLPPPRLTVGKAQFSWYSSPGQVYLRHIRPQDMIPVIHALGQGVFSKLFAGFFCAPASEEASFWDDGHANRLIVVCGIRSEN